MSDMVQLHRRAVRACGQRRSPNGSKAFGRGDLIPWKHWHVVTLSRCPRSRTVWKAFQNCAARTSAAAGWRPHTAAPAAARSAPGWLCPAARARPQAAASPSSQPQGNPPRGPRHPRSASPPARPAHEKGLRDRRQGSDTVCAFRGADRAPSCGAHVAITQLRHQGALLAREGLYDEQWPLCAPKALPATYHRLSPGWFASALLQPPVHKEQRFHVPSWQLLLTLTLCAFTRAAREPESKAWAADSAQKIGLNPEHITAEAHQLPRCPAPLKRPAGKQHGCLSARSLGEQP